MNRALSNAPADPAQRRLELHVAVSRACDGADDVDQAVDAVLARIGEEHAWPAGILWLYHRHARELRLSRCWARDEARRARLERRLTATTLAPGEGLPGQAFFLGDATFSDARRPTLASPEIDAAAAAGFGGVVCVPFRSPRAVLGCLEFFLDSFEEPERATIETVEDVGSKLGAYYELHRAAEELDALVRAFPDLYFRLDRDGVILDYHASVTGGLHHLASQCVGKRLQEFVTPEIAPRIEAMMRSSQESGDLATLEYSLPLPSGPRAYELRIVPMAGAQLMCVVRDVTDPRRVEPRLAESRGNATPLFEALDALLGSALTVEQRRCALAAQSTARALF